MAVVSMGGTGDQSGSNSNRVFHDFLGMSHGEAPPAVRIKGGVADGSRSLKPLEIPDNRVSISASAGASSSERGFVPMSADLGSGIESNYQRSGRKRANSDSPFMDFPRERMTPQASGFPENSSKLKILPKEAVKETGFGVHPPPLLTSASFLIHQPHSSRHDPVGSKWEQPSPLKPGAMMQNISCFSQNTMQRDKHPPVSIPFVSQAAADEGSRTGGKSGNFFSLINSGGDKAAGSPRINEPDPSNTLSRSSSLSSGNRQMTIFYGGKAHVFDDVPPNKADVIMTLAGSDGGSWSTSFSPKSSAKPVPLPAEESTIGSSPLPQDLSRRLSLRGLSGHVLGQTLRFHTSGDKTARETRLTNTVETDGEERRDAL